MGCCFYCNVQMRHARRNRRGAVNRTMPTTDHVIPRSRVREGGLGAYPIDNAHWMTLNTVTACWTCNNAKSDMWPLDWLLVMAEAGVQRLHDRLLELGCPRGEIIDALAYRGVYQALMVEAA